MQPSIEYLLRKYEISPKDQQNVFSLAQRRSLGSLHNLSSPRLGRPVEKQLYDNELKIQDLKSDLSDTKSKLATISFQLDKEVSTKHIETDNELKLLLNKNKALKDQVVFLKNQIEFYENESKRAQEQYSIDKKTWAIQYENLKRQLSYKQLEESSYAQNAKHEKEESRALREQISDLCSNEKALQEKLSALQKAYQAQEKLFIEKSLISQEEMKHQKNDYELSLQELKIENDKLKSLIAGQNSEIADLEQNLKELEHINMMSEDARDTLKKQQITTQGFIKDMLSANEHMADKARHETKKPIVHKKIERSGSRKKLRGLNNAVGVKESEDGSGRKKVTLPSYLNQEGKLEEAIQDLETEIDKINSNYKRILNSKYEGAQDYMKIKLELDKISKILDEKVRSLFVAKRKYSNIVREKMISNLDNF